MRRNEPVRLDPVRFGLCPVGSGSVAVRSHGALVWSGSVSVPVPFRICGRRAVSARGQSARCTLPPPGARKRCRSSTCRSRSKTWTANMLYSTYIMLYYNLLYSIIILYVHNMLYCIILYFASSSMGSQGPSPQTPKP